MISEPSHGHGSIGNHSVLCEGFPMDKHIFFEQLEKELAQKYNLTPYQIGVIRSSILGSKRTRKELAEWIAIKLTLPKRHMVHATGKLLSHSQSRTRGKEHYQTLLNFIASCSDIAWNDITQKTEYDK